MEVTKPFVGDHGKVLTSKWYHLKLMAYECQLVAIANILPEGPRTSLTVNPCARLSIKVPISSSSCSGLTMAVISFMPFHLPPHLHGLHFDD